MTRAELPRLINEIAALWPALRLTTESNVIFVGFRRRNGRFVPGIFASCEVQTAIDTCREWAAEHPGSLPTWNDGRGWQEIKFAVRQAVETAQPSREDRLLQEHRQHYQDCRVPWPGDDIVLRFIQRGEPTPLQRKSTTWAARLRQHLHDRYPDEDFDGARKRRERARREAVNEMTAREARRDKAAPIKLRPANWGPVTPGHKMPWGFVSVNPADVAKEQTAAGTEPAQPKKVVEHEHAVGQ